MKLGNGYTVGFIGIGNMGWGMAANLANAGVDLRVFDTDQARVSKFVDECGGSAARTVGDLGDRKFIVTMLPTGAIVKNVLIGSGSLAGQLQAGAIVMDMSSSEPMGTRELGMSLSQHGTALIDAPVSGGVVRATNGQLTIMVGTDDEMALEQAMPLLNVMGSQIFRTGPLGSGHAMKAINNYVAAATFAASSEALAMGSKFGLDLNTMVDIMNVSTGRNFHTDLILKNHVVGGKFGAGFAIGLLAKDIKIAADLSHDLAQQSPLLELMQHRWFEARDKVGPASDYTTAHRAWVDLSEEPRSELNA
ncbi:MAG: NAD(P)-dependent oxidoreductase [Achromobacter sp.]|nr:NAD(P)-dependent oxidoreductase [Achromobacter sp.]